MLPFPCLGSVNNSVFAVRTGWIPLGDILASCKQMTTISVPIRRYGDIKNELTLMWFRPYCKSCELDGRTVDCRVMMEKRLVLVLLPFTVHLFMHKLALNHESDGNQFSLSSLHF
ncbi:hypothetical protein L2E82_34592 [Cichorium intybus]|uniref:Uncharacterized protein n=1 Tax=Cichorium intybus TaxID=13427 RepID=A0ACB9BMD9_CICIN|nr:hypothetical protein L2E82_34592 [Cichorium intybus]